jgi:O-antigen/teichoic acid export membrane protein
VLAVRGGAELVALWAQLASVMELVTGVALAGVGTGLAVYVARTRRPERQRDLLREALRIGLAVGAPLAVAIGIGASIYADALSGEKLAPVVFALSAAAGWAAVIPGLVNGYWLGQQRRSLMLALAVGSAALTLAAAAVAPPEFILHVVVVCQALPAAVLFVVADADGTRARFRAHSHPLRRYVLPGLAIGLLGPLSMLLARGAVGEALSWHEAGVLQSLWRLSDWVCAFAGGVLSVHYLPRLAEARSGPRLAAAMGEAVKTILIPSALIFVALYLLHRPLLGLLYDPAFQAGNSTVALFFAGSLVRIASWIPLFALYAMRRTRAIALGELLSLPLFAAGVLSLGAQVTLEAAGALWLAAYVAYGIFNLWAARARQ